MPNYLNIGLNTAYLNRSPNKTDRGQGGYKPIAALWHETAGYGSLDYCLRPEVAASFNYLIDRAGTIWHYIDETRYIAWGGGLGPAGIVNGIAYNGLSFWKIGTTNYRGSQLNEAFIHVEMEGPNDGTPIEPEQTESGLRLMLYFNAKYGMSLEAVYHPEHHQVAPLYKTDARGYSIEQLRLMALARRDSATGASPTGYTIDSRLLKIWEACGGLGREVAGVGWVAGPGYAIGPVRAAPDGNGIIQQCERYWVGIGAQGKPRIPLTSEIRDWGR